MDLKKPTKFIWSCSTRVCHIDNSYDVMNTKIYAAIATGHGNIYINVCLIQIM